jgi:hypothetical protein
MWLYPQLYCTPYRLNASPIFAWIVFAAEIALLELGKPALVIPKPCRLNQSFRCTMSAPGDGDRWHELCGLVSAYAGSAP